MVPRASASPETSRMVAEEAASGDVARQRVGEGDDNNLCFEDLRGVRWRIDLGILPSTSSTDEIRCVAANCRRRYAGLRRSLLVDPHFRMDVNNSPEVVIDDPLSQNPDSKWGRFFRNAELEKMVDQDLSRLYPEHGSYFQTPLCQSMLRRILLLWCLKHPDCGYRQGMHELLAPFLYVLHVDVEHLSEVQSKYTDQFTEYFEDLALPNYDCIYGSGTRRSQKSKEDFSDSHEHPSKRNCFDEIDPKVQNLISLSDAYGAEGELGIVLSQKFMEHDAYCMFEALMSGSHGAVSLSDFFSPAPAIGSHTGLPPIIEASSALYHLLSITDSSLHSHLIELGVEPQYFGLRWLRVLFGREFSLPNLLQIWDAIFSSDNGKSNKESEDTGSTFTILTSARGAFIAALALSMILHLRSSLLASENSTSCLQRLLNFPDNVSIKKLIMKAKSLRTFAMEANKSSHVTSSKSSHYRSKSMFVTCHNIPSSSASPTTPVSVIPESYWEEKWRFVQKAEELSENSSVKRVSSNKKRWSDKVKFSLSRADSAPSSLKVKNSVKEPSSSVRRNLLADLSMELGLDKDDGNSDINQSVSVDNDCHKLGVEEKGENIIVQSEGCSSDENPCSNDNEDKLTSAAETSCGRPNEHGSDSEKSVVEIDVKDRYSAYQDEDENCINKKNYFISSASERTCSRLNEHETVSEQSSPASNLSVEDNYDESSNATCEATPDFRPSVRSDPLHATLTTSENSNDLEGQSVPKLKDRRPSGKFQWLWRFGRNPAGEGTSERGSHEYPKSPTAVEDFLKASPGSKSSSVCKKGDVSHKESIISLKSLSQSLLENIQIIESVLRTDNSGSSSLEKLATSKIVDQGQVDVVAALRELRKISNLLSEM